MTAVHARRQRRRVPYERWVVIGGPFAVSTTITLFWPMLHLAIAGVAGALLVAWLSQRPGLPLRLLGAILPLQLLALSGLYEAGLPRELVRPMGFWKEAMVGAIVVSAVRRARREGHRLDVLDRLAIGYVALGLLFLLVPGLLVDGPGASIAFGTRLNGFRTDVVYVLLFVAARHARLPAEDVVRAARWFVAVTVVAAGIAVVELLADGWWNTFVTGTLGLTRYKLEVLDVVPGTDPYLYDVRAHSAVGGRDVLRVGGIVVDYLQFGFWLALGVALALERQVRRLQRPVAAAAIGLLAVAVLFTQTRSAVVGLGIVVLLALRRQAGRSRGARVRVTLVVGALATVAVPVAVGIGLVDRLGGDEHSDDLHSSSASSGLELLLEDPAGRGLATAAGAGQRDTGTGFVTTENQLLQIGTQLGVVGLLLWGATYVGVVTASRRAVVDAREHDVGLQDLRAVSAGTGLALTGLAPSMIFLQIFIYLPFAWTAFALAGASLGALEAARQQGQPATATGTGWRSSAARTAAPR